MKTESLGYPVDADCYYVNMAVGCILSSRLFQMLCFLAVLSAHGMGLRCRTSVNLFAGPDMSSIFSPNHSGNYPSNCYCSWTIRTHLGYVVRLEIMQIDLEHSVGYVYDRLSIYDGADENAELLDKICTSVSNTYDSSGQYMHVTFVSDSAESGSGFILRYKGVETSSSPDITTTNTTDPTSAPESEEDYGLLLGRILISLVFIGVPLMMVVGLIRSVYRARHSQPECGHDVNQTTTPTSGEGFAHPDTTDHVFTVSGACYCPTYSVRSSCPDPPPAYEDFVSLSERAVRRNGPSAENEPTDAPPSYYEYMWDV